VTAAGNTGNVRVERLDADVQMISMGAHERVSVNRASVEESER
jgi:hypothetical protein